MAFHLGRDLLLFYERLPTAEVLDEPDEFHVLEFLHARPDGFGDRKGKEGLNVAPEFFRLLKQAGLDCAEGGIEMKDQEKDEQSFRSGDRNSSKIRGWIKDTCQAGNREKIFPNVAMLLRERE